MTPTSAERAEAARQALLPNVFGIDANEQSDTQAPTEAIRYFVSSTDSQLLFLGLFALLVVDTQPEIYQWNFPGWSRSHWSLPQLENRNDALLMEHPAQVVDQFYPGATSIRPQ